MGKNTSGLIKFIYVGVSNVIAVIGKELFNGLKSGAVLNFPADENNFKLEIRVCLHKL